MPNDRMVEPAENFFEYVIRILAHRSKHAIDLCAFNAARERIAHRRKARARHRHLRLVHPNSNTE